MLSRCEFCKKVRFGVVEKSVSTAPGTAKFYNICKKCLTKCCFLSFEEKMGMTNLKNPDAKFVRYVGSPFVTASKYGANASGSILAEYDDGSRIGVMCGHGGSAWLCLACAQEIIEKQSKKASA